VVTREAPGYAHVSKDNSERGAARDVKASQQQEKQEELKSTNKQQERNTFHKE
jgi:hypothetical protein